MNNSLIKNVDAWHHHHSIYYSSSSIIICLVCQWYAGICRYDEQLKLLHHKKANDAISCCFSSFLKSYNLKQKIAIFRILFNMVYQST